MSSNPQPARLEDITCSRCGKLNARDRAFCWNCGSRLEQPSAPPPPPPPPLPPPVEVKTTPADQRDQFLQQIKNLLAEIETKAQAHAALQQQHDAVLQKANALETDLSSKQTEFEKLAQALKSAQELIDNHNQGRKAGMLNTWWAKTIAGLLVALLSGPGGYTVAKYRSSGDKVVKDLTTRLANSDKQVQELSPQVEALKDQLAKANATTQSATADLATTKQKLQDTDARSRTAQSRANALQSELGQRVTAEAALKQTLQSQGQSLDQARKDKRDAEGKFQNLVQRHPAWGTYLNYTGPLSGNLKWQGQLAKGKTVEIQPGLPGVPCIVRSSNKSVVIMEQPGPKNWNKISVRADKDKIDSVDFFWSAF